MSKTSLFNRESMVGIFRGFSESGLEFHADIILPYRNEFQAIPMHGQFLLVQLANEEEAVLGRITSFYSDGKMTKEHGENFSLRIVEEEREIPEDLLEQYVKYRVNIRVLGVIRLSQDRFVFVSSHRRLPHVGSRVAFPGEEVLKVIVGHHQPGADLGFFALGEFIYTGSDRRMSVEDWMQVKSPTLITRFPIQNLVSRRSFVFARAGFGKSNLIKLLFSELYLTTPTKQKRGREIPVGTIVFDPDGEYFFPDDNGRPGLADVPHLRDKLVVFTHRQAPSDFYQSFIAGGIKLDIRLLPPASVIGVALSPERQEQQNVRKLRSLSSAKWIELVNLVYRQGYGAKLEEIKSLLNIGEGGEAEANAALNNIVYVVRTLHDPESRFLDFLFQGLRAGKLCVVDISQMRGKNGLILSSIILQEIFNHNQENFTAKDPLTIPTIVVMEEAQSILGGNEQTAAPLTEWFKEGRKYDLGAVLITQQPGSIPVELLSQGDNWFVFHLLSASDLKSLQRANAHFSDDLLGGLLNEPIPGQGVVWSSVGTNPYPISFRALSFERIYSRLDVDYNLNSVETFATSLLESSPPSLQSDIVQTPHFQEEDSIPNTNGHTPAHTDTLSEAIRRAIDTVAQSGQFQQQVMRGNGTAWGILISWVQEALPENLKNNIPLINSSVIRPLLNEAIGEGKWTSEKRKTSKGKDTTWVSRIREPAPDS